MPVAVPEAGRRARARHWQAPANLGSPGRGDSLGRRHEEVGMPVEAQEVQDVEELTDEDVDELLVEEVSIDGMCGVY
jgi:mycofactocin precursor